MEKQIISIVVITIALLGFLLEIAATMWNNKEDPKRNNYYRAMIYTIMLFWGLFYGR